MSVRVKICGVTNLADAQAAAEAGVWAIGFNFVPASPRFIEPAVAREIRSRLPSHIQTAGVFVNESRSRISAITDEVGLSMLQFHGDEPPDMCSGWSVSTIKALRVRDRTAVGLAARYAVDFILADAYVEGAFGGTGKTLDLTMLEDLDRSRLIVAGGLNPENVGNVVRVVRPLAVDVASGVERAPGLKDHDLIRRFIANAYAA